MIKKEHTEVKTAHKYWKRLESTTVDSLSSDPISMVSFTYNNCHAKDKKDTAIYFLQISVNGC